MFAFDPFQNVVVRRVIWHFLAAITLILSALTGLNMPASVTRANTLIVTTTANAGAGSLRTQITAANSGDTITFSPSLNGQTISLSSELSITKDLTITGLGAQALTITAPDSRAFNIHMGAVVSISDISINNTTNPGDTFGGAIHTEGSLTIANMEFNNNTAGDGGAIYCNVGRLRILNSTFTGNTVQHSFGGYGGAIFSMNATFVGINSTFVNNQALNRMALGGAAYVSTTTQSAFIFNSTFDGNSADNGGGNIRSNSAQLFNSIVVNGTAPFGPDILGELGGSGYNIIESANDVTGANATDQIGADPLLQPLALNAH